jgi:ATP-dependent Clp protease ATP-binding subunit ClpC
MFERFDEPARRTLFYARHAASELRSRSIQGEHLLLGLIREGSGHAARVLSALPLPDLRKELEDVGGAEPVHVSVEIPFTPETKRMLAYAAEEADLLAHRAISTGHLLLGVMREEGSTAAAALGRYGLRLHTVREQVSVLPSAAPSAGASNPGAHALVEQLTQSAEQLGELLSDHEEASMRTDLLLMDLRAIKSLLEERR